MDFKKMDEHATAYANLMLAKKAQKKVIRDNILDLIALSGYQYNNDASYREQVNEYLRKRKTERTISRFIPPNIPYKEGEQ